MTSELETRVKLWLRTIQKNLYQPMEEITWEAFETDQYLSAEEAERKLFYPVKTGDAWGKEWEYGWFRTNIALKDWAAGKRIVMDLHIGGEATLFVDGEPFGARRDDWIVQEHHFLCDNYLTRSAKGDETYCLLAECYGGHSRPEDAGECISGPYFLNRRWERPDGDKKRKMLGKSTIGIWREEAYHLYLEATALYEIWQNEPEESLRRAELEEALRRFCLTLSFEVSEEEYESSVLETRKIISPYLACKNADTTPLFHMIGHAHIDLAWLWPVEETFRKCARTMAAQIRHMEEYPEYKMIISQPWLMEQIELRYPTLFDRMRKKIETGQLLPEGGMWVEADTNLPSGESLIRQFYYGKKYFREKFGMESTLLWLPDVFGYCGNLPQIMKGCGMTHFTTHKIFWTYNGGETFPYHYFNWKGIDGSAIPTFIHVEYSSPTNPDTLIKRWKSRAQKSGIRRFLQPFGYGDGGGGPSRDHMEYCILGADMEGTPRMIFDDPKHFFACLEEDGCMKNTIGEPNEYVGELYYQAHRGTYTTQGNTKKGNRKGEAALGEAEFFATLATVLKKEAYPAKQLEEAWKQLLFQQFHDILPGSSIQKVYRQAEISYKELMKACADLKKIAADSFLQPREDAVTCINIFSWERKAVIKLPDHWGCKEQYHRVTIPPCGAVTLYQEDAVNSKVAGEYDKTVYVQMEKDGREAVLGNDKLEVRIDHIGRFISVKDKSVGEEWTAGYCNELKMYEDIPGHFEAWDLDSLYREKEIPLSSEGKVEVLLSEAVIAKVRVTRYIGDSILVQTISLEAGSAVIQVHNKIDWQERHKILKAAFPVAIQTNEFCSEIQFGMIKRPNHTSVTFDRDRFEVCNHRWSALMDELRGAAVLNDCKYGISCTSNRMELTLLKASGFPDEEADAGEQEFTYGFTFWNDGFAQSDVVRDGYELNQEVTIMEGEASIPKLFELSDTNVILSAVKRAQDQSGTVIRLYESKGTRSNLSIKAGFPLKEVYRTDMLENRRDKAQVIEGEIFLSFGPFEVKTLLLEDQIIGDH